MAGVEPSLSFGTDVMDIVHRYTKTADTLDVMILYLPSHDCGFDLISLLDSLPELSLSSMLAFSVEFMF